MACVPVYLSPPPPPPRHSRIMRAYAGSPSPESLYLGYWLPLAKKKKKIPGFLGKSSPDYPKRCSEKMGTHTRPPPYNAFELGPGINPIIILINVHRHYNSNVSLIRNHDDTY